jgi:CRP-like cAMP-binding protein
MTDSSLEQLLGEHPFFFGMKSDYLEVLAGCATAADFVRGSAVFKEGEPADACWLIVEGDIALEVVVPGRGPHVIQTLHSGEVLGWSWLFSPYRWSFDAQALTDTKAIRFDAEALRTAKNEDKEFGFELMQRFAEVLVDRLQATRLQLLDIYGATH